MRKWEKELMGANERAESNIDPRLASKILGVVPHNSAFYFYVNIGQYSGRSAISLADFCKKIKVIDVRSVNFHFKRMDFEEWIKGTLGDLYLANEISRINRSIQGEDLRTKIHQLVDARLTELKKVLASEEANLPGTA